MSKTALMVVLVLAGCAPSASITDPAAQPAKSDPGYDDLDKAFNEVDQSPQIPPGELK